MINLNNPKWIPLKTNSLYDDFYITKKHFIRKFKSNLNFKIRVDKDFYSNYHFFVNDTCWFKVNADNELIFHRIDGCADPITVESKHWYFEGKVLKEEYYWNK